MPPETPSEVIWPELVVAGLALLGVLVVVGILLNVNKMLSRLTAIRRQLQETQEAGPGAQLMEAVTQLQSLAVSLDRIAMRCDAMDSKLGAIVDRSPSGSDPAVAGAVATIRDGIAELRTPLGEIRDLISRTETERLAEEIKRNLYSMGYDVVTIRTDLSTLPRHGEGKAQVEVSREGVKSKGFVVVRDGGVVEKNISPTYEMFP